MAISIGSTFGLLTVVSRLHNYKRKTWWVCRCACGSELVIVRSDRLTRGETSSCGCIRSHRNGLSGSSTYITWQAMRRRCNDPKHPRYDDYGGRGIRVCDRWNDSKTGFESFIQDVGLRPNDRTLDRIDTNGNYEPGNVKWATIIEQRWNRRDTRRELIDELNAENAYWDEQERLRRNENEIAVEGDIG